MDSEVTITNEQKRAEHIKAALEHISIAEHALRRYSNASAEMHATLALAHFAAADHIPRTYFLPGT